VAVEYPPEIHNSRAEGAAQASEELLVDGGPLMLRRGQDDGMVTGSEWVYTDPNPATPSGLPRVGA